MSSGLSRINRDERLGRVTLGADRSVVWADYLADLAERGDRLGALKLISAATGYVPLDHQLRGHLSTARFKLLCGGVGCGKTLFSMSHLVLLCLLNELKTNSIVLGPSFSQVQAVLLPVFLDICEKFKEMGAPILKRYHRSYARADLVGGGKIYFRSFARAENLRGYEVATACIDESEVSAKPQREWDIIQARLRQTANVRELWVSTTPRGYRGIPRLFLQMRKDKKERPNWWTGRASSTENPHLPEGFVDSLKAGYSKRAWEQECYGAILRPSHQVWSEFSLARHVRPWPAFDPALPYHIISDWGFAHPYYGFIQIAKDGSGVLFDEIHRDEWPIDHQKAELIKRVRALGVEPVHFVGDRAVREMCSWAIGAFPKTWFHRMRTKAHQRIDYGIECVRELLDPLEGSPKFYIAEHLAASEEPRSMVQTMQSYAWRVDREGQIIEGEAQKNNVHDHQADALRYWAVALHSDKQGPQLVNFSNDKYKHRHNRRP